MCGSFRRVLLIAKDGNICSTAHKSSKELKPKMNVDVRSLLKRPEDLRRHALVRGGVCLLGLTLGLLTAARAQGVSQIPQAPPAAAEQNPPKSEFPTPFRYPGQRYLEYPALSGATQPFHLNGMPTWATIAFDLRERTDGMTALDYTSGNGRAYEETREWGSLELRPTSHLTVYGQFVDTHALGLPLKYVSATQRDVFDLRQGYVEFHYQPVELFAGRKELRFGQERLIGISNFTNTSRTFDGFYGRIGDQNRLDLFSTSVVIVHPTSLDTHGAGLTFHGAYATLDKLVPKTSIEPYVVIHAIPRVESQLGVYGSETRVTPGIEVVGGLPHNFDYDVFGNFQRGSYSTESIHAGSTIDKLSYTATTLPWVPRIGGEYDYATGNDLFHTQRWSTYDQSYPSNHNAFGLLDLFGFQNIRQERLNIDLEPVNKVHVLIQQNFLNLATAKDGVYNGSATEFIKPPVGGFSSTDIGKEFDASAKYTFHKYWVFDTGVGHFLAGAAMHQGKDGEDQTFGYLSLVYRFRIDH